MLRRTPNHTQLENYFRQQKQHKLYACINYTEGTTEIRYENCVRNVAVCVLVTTLSKYIHIPTTASATCIYCSTPFLTHLGQLNEDEATYINGVVYIYLFVLLWLVWICSHIYASDKRLMRTITSDSIRFYFLHWKMICLSNIFSLAGTLKWCAIEVYSLLEKNGWIHETTKSNRRNWLRRMTSTLDERRKGRKKYEENCLIRNIGSSHWLACYMERKKKTPQSIQHAADVVRVSFFFHFCSLLSGAHDIQYPLVSLRNLFMSFFFATSPSGIVHNVQALRQVKGLPPIEYGSRYLRRTSTHLEPTDWCKESEMRRKK